MAILNNSNAISTSGAYDINNSLRFRASASAYLSRTFSASGTTDTWSFWVKRGALSSNQYIFGWTNSSTASLQLNFESDNTFSFVNVSGGLLTAQLTTTQVFRDPSAWYHIVMVIDTTQATAANRLKLYVNGTQVTSFGTATYPAQNASLAISNSAPWDIGARGATNSIFLDGYLAEFNFIDGQALTPSSFGETDTTTGSWKPKAYTGTYGTNGFELNFSDIATTSGSNAGLGKDNSGNGNFWNTNNISVTAGVTYDAMTDSPTLTSATVANYATMNPIKSPPVGTYSNANLTVAFGTNDFTPALATIYPTSGKWYWEAVWVSGTYSRLGVQNTTVATTDFGADTASWRWGSNDGQIYNNTNLITVSTYATGDVLGFCLDLDAGKLYVSKNGTWQNSAVPASGTGAVATNIPTNTPMSPAGSTGYLPTTNTWNFGQRPFAYTPPSGFLALNTYNLPDSTIKKGNTVMDATLYTGTGATLSVTNTGSFYPSFTWIKKRSAAASHTLFDTIRGATNYLVSDSTGAETTAVNSLTAFNSNGFTLGNGSGVNTNDSASTYVAWQWNANNGSTSSNTSGSITSTVSVNTTAGFSVVTYTSQASGTATFGHGLGVAPSMIFLKSRNLAAGWYVYHSALGGTKYVVLQGTNAAITAADGWNNTNPTSTVVSVGNGYAGSYNMVAYCWAEIAGFSKFGSYTGNGSTDGTFVYTGFRPRFLIWKRTDSTSNWWMVDTARAPYNTSSNLLFSNLSNAEFTGTGAEYDILSNGFKFRNNDATAYNVSGASYIYMAFAENPLKFSNAR
jgi:hypothetical protein